jgi:transcriptional regulator with GAF, ATPase, and Fis domain
MSAPSVVETSYIPAKEEEAEQASAEDSTAPSAVSEDAPTQKVKSKKKKKKRHISKRIPSQELHIGRAAEVVDLNEVLAEVFEAMQDLYAISSLEGCIAFGTKLAADKIPCQAAVGLAMTSSREDMVCVSSHGSGAEKLSGTKIPLKGSLVGFAVRQGVAVAVSDAEKDPRVSEDLDKLVGTETRSVLCAPLTFEGRTFGVMELINRKDGDTWQQGEINILSYIGSQMAEYIAESLASEVDDFSDLDEESKPAMAMPQPTTKPRPRPAQSAASRRKRKRKRKK